MKPFSTEQNYCNVLYFTKLDLPIDVNEKYIFNVTFIAYHNLKITFLRNIG